MRNSRNKYQQTYEKLRDEWRAKYGAYHINKLWVDETMAIEAGRVLIALGQWRRQHHINLKTRRYQERYRNENRQKVREYHRVYKRKTRGSSLPVYQV